MRTYAGGTLGIRDNGFQHKIEAMQQKKEQPSTVVIILTNYPYPPYRQEYMDEGADFFFNKSTEFGKIVDVCKRLVQDSCV